MNDLEEIVYKHALLNAAKHKGSANPGGSYWFNYESGTGFKK